MVLEDIVRKDVHVGRIVTTTTTTSTTTSILLYPNKQLAIHAIEIGMEIAARVLPQVEPLDFSHLPGQLSEVSLKHEHHIAEDDKYFNVNDIEKLYDIGRCNPFLSFGKGYTCWDYTVDQRVGVDIEERIERDMEVSFAGPTERSLRPDLIPPASHASDPEGRRRLSHQGGAHQHQSSSNSNALSAPSGGAPAPGPPICGTETTTPPPLEELRATVALQKSYRCDDSPCWKNEIVRAVPRCPPKQQCSASDLTCNVTDITMMSGPSTIPFGEGPDAADSPAAGASALCWRETPLTVVFENFNVSNMTHLSNTTEDTLIGLNLLRRFRECTTVDTDEEEFDIFSAALHVYNIDTTLTNATFNYSRPLPFVNGTNGSLIPFGTPWFKAGNAFDYVHNEHPYGDVHSEGACYHINEIAQEVAFHRHNFAFLTHAAGGDIDTSLFDPVNRAAYGAGGLIDDLTTTTSSSMYGNSSDPSGSDPRACAAVTQKCYCDDVCHLTRYDDCCTRCRPADERVGVFGGIGVCVNWRSWIQSKFPECPARVVPPWARAGAFPSFEKDDHVDASATHASDNSTSTDAATCTPPVPLGPTCPVEIQRAVPQAWREALPFLIYADGCDQERNSMDVDIPDFAGIRLFLAWRCACPVIDANTGAVAVDPFALLPGLSGWTLDVNDPDAQHMFKPCQTDADCGGCASVCTAHEGTAKKDCRSPPSVDGNLNAPGSCLRHFRAPALEFSHEDLQACFPAAQMNATAFQVKKADCTYDPVSGEWKRGFEQRSYACTGVLAPQPYCGPSTTTTTTRGPCWDASKAACSSNGALSSGLDNRCQACDPSLNMVTCTQYSWNNPTAGSASCDGGDGSITGMSAVMSARNGFLTDSGMGYLCYPDGCDQQKVEDAACRNDICDDNHGDCCLDPNEQPACLRGYYPLMADRIVNYPAPRPGFPQGGISFKDGGCPVERTFECCRPTTTTTTTAEPLIDAMCRDANGQLDYNCIDRERLFYTAEGSDSRDWTECVDDEHGVAAYFNSTVCEQVANGTESCDHWDTGSLHQWQSVLHDANASSSLVANWTASLPQRASSHGFYLWQLCPRTCGRCMEAGHPTNWMELDGTQGYACEHDGMLTYNSSESSHEGLVDSSGYVGKGFTSAISCGQRCVDYNNNLTRVRAPDAPRQVKFGTSPSAESLALCRAVTYWPNSGRCELCRSNRTDDRIPTIHSDAKMSGPSKDKGPIGNYEMAKMSSGALPGQEEFCPEGTKITSEYECRQAAIAMGGFDVDA